MLFGRASLIEDPEEKLLESQRSSTTSCPGAAVCVVPPTAPELRQVSFLKMPIDQAVVKVRNYPASHEPAAARGHAVWAGEIPDRDAHRRAGAVRAARSQDP